MTRPGPQDPGDAAPRSAAPNEGAPDGRVPDEGELVATLLALVAARGPGKTICPSEVARALGGPHPDGWAPLMKPVRWVAVRLMREGRVAILRKGRVVDDPEGFRGVYRLGPPPG